MKKGLTELVFILDRSGSMRGVERDTIGGFNGMIEEQKKKDGEALVSAVLFDDRAETLYDRVDLKDITEMTSEQYYVRGCTALLDAVGSTIDHIKSARKQMPKEERPEKTIFVITTDGLENASHEYSYEKVKHLIEKRQAKNWEFIFLGANIDAAAEAGKMGIKAGRAVNYNCDDRGTALNFKVLNETIGYMRDCESAVEMSEMMECCNFFDEIEEDFQNRTAGE